MIAYLKIGGNKARDLQELKANLRTKIAATTEQDVVGTELKIQRALGAVCGWVAFWTKVAECTEQVSAQEEQLRGGMNPGNSSSSDRLRSGPRPPWRLSFQEAPKRFGNHVD